MMIQSNSKRVSRFASALALSLGGCAASTGILPVGPDTYTVTEHDAPVRGGAIAAQQNSIAQARAHCAAQGKQLMVLDKETLPVHNPWGATEYSVTFRCLEAGTQLPVPAEVIEHQYKP
jgi:hypothetical protein